MNNVTSGMAAGLPKLSLLPDQARAAIDAVQGAGRSSSSSTP